AEADQREAGEDEHRAAPPATGSDGDRAERPDGVHRRGMWLSTYRPAAESRYADRSLRITSAEATGAGTANTSRPGTRRCCQYRIVDTVATPMSVASLAGWI